MRIRLTTAMFSKRIARWLLAVAVVSMVFGVQQSTRAALLSLTTSQAGAPLAPSLAKAKLAEATAAAKKWRADAFLIQIAASNIRDDGLHVLWDYGFYSPAAKNCLVVNVAKTVATRESGGAICESPELKEFMDSDQAMMIAPRTGSHIPRRRWS